MTLYDVEEVGEYHIPFDFAHKRCGSVGVGGSDLPSRAATKYFTLIELEIFK